MKSWIDFLKRQQNAFKTNILKNIAQKFSTFLTYQYQSIYILRLGASPIILGYIGSLGGVVNTLLSIPAGVFADRLGIKKVFLFTIMTYILSAIFFGLAYSWELAAIALVLSSVAMTLDRTTCPIICGATLDSSERVTGMGICDTLSFFPQLIAPLAAAFLISLFGGLTVNGIRPLYFLQVTGLLIAFIIIYTKFENPKLKERRNPASGFFGNIGEVFSKGVMVKRWLLMMLFSSFPWQVSFYVPLFASEIKGANQFIIGGMSSASTIVLVFLAIPLGQLADQRGRKKMMTVSVALVCVSYLILIFTQNNWFLLLSGFLSGFIMTAGGIQMAIAADLVPQQYLGSWYGLLGFFRGLVGIISPIICGYLWEYISPQSVFYLLILTRLASLSIFLTIPTKITR